MKNIQKKFIQLKKNPQVLCKFNFKYYTENYNKLEINYLNKLNTDFKRPVKELNFPNKTIENYYHLENIFRNKNYGFDSETEKNLSIIEKYIKNNLFQLEQEEINEIINDNKKVFEFFKSFFAIYKDSSDLIIKNLILMIKYIKTSFQNNSQLIDDSQFYEALKNGLILFNLKISNLQSPEKIKLSLEFYMECLEIRDLVLKQGNVNQNFLSTIENFLSEFIKNDELNSEIISELILLDSNSLSQNISIIYSYIYILAQVQDFFQLQFKSMMLKNKIKKEKFINLISNLQINKNNFFHLDIEKIIIYFLSLEKIGLLKHEIVRDLTYENFDIDSFHIFFTTLLSKPEYINDINGLNVSSMLIEKIKMGQFFENFNVRKLILMRKTLDWIIQTNFSYITFHNQQGMVQYHPKDWMLYVFHYLLKLLPESENPDEIFYIAYLFTNYAANPTVALEKISQKTFDLESITPEILKKFIDSVDFRTKYFVRYDHEIHLLKKLKRDVFIPYDSSLDKIISSITLQFFDKINEEKDITPEIFEIGLKCLKIVFNNDINDPDYKINKSIQDNIKQFVDKFLTRGSKYLNYITPENGDLVITLTRILPYLKYYYFKNTKIENNLFEDFLIILVNKNFTKFEHKIKILTNIAEHVILESMNKICQNQDLPEKFYEINSYITHNIQPYIFPNDSNLNLENLYYSPIEYSQIPIILINLYNVFIMNPEIGKYKNFIVQLNEYFQNMRGLRNLKGYELLKLRNEIMNENTLFQILSNLQTIQHSITKENLLSGMLKPALLKKYILDIINSLSTASVNSQANLSSLSFLIANIFDHFSHLEIVQILKILGNRKVENYHPIFIKNLVTKFSNGEFLFPLMKTKEDEFFSLALQWPLFIKNEELVKTLLYCHETKLLQLSRYQIINVLSYNHANHAKLLTFFGYSINKVKKLNNKKKILCEYLSNCTYVGYKMENKLYEEILSIYRELINSEISLGRKFSFSLDELCDIISIAVISNILDTSLTKESQKTFFSIVTMINEQITSKLKLKYNNTEITYYPSIKSEDRYFHKSLSNIYNSYEEMLQDEEEEEEGDSEKIPNDEKDEIKDENKDESTINKNAEAASKYIRKAHEGRQTVDVEFENYFNKKRELMYGHQAYITDDSVTRQLLKKWCIAKIYKLNIQDEFLANQVNLILNKLNDVSRNSTVYEKFYLKILSYGFQYNFIIDSNYKEPVTGIKIDYLINYKDKRFYVIYIPDIFTSTNLTEDYKHPDGIYLLLIQCLKNVLNCDVIPILENSVSEFTEKDYQNIFLKRILE